MALVLAAAHSGGPIPWLGLIFVGTVVGGVVWLNIVNGRERTRAMQALAQRHGLDWFDQKLPRDFPTSMLDSLYSGWLGPRWSGVRNVIGGAEKRDTGKQDYLLAFDIRVQAGRSSIRKTIVARRSTNFTPGALLPAEFVARTAGQWRMAAKQEGFFSVSRTLEPTWIERLWDLLR